MPFYWYIAFRTYELRNDLIFRLDVSSTRVCVKWDKKCSHFDLFRFELSVAINSTYNMNRICLRPKNMNGVILPLSNTYMGNGTDAYKFYRFSTCHR